MTIVNLAASFTDGGHTLLWRRSTVTVAADDCLDWPEAYAGGARARNK